MDCRQLPHSLFFSLFSPTAISSSSTTFPSFFSSSSYSSSLSSPPLLLALLPASVPADVRARPLLLLRGRHLHAAQPELRDHQEAGVPRPQGHSPVQPPLLQGERRCRATPPNPPPLIPQASDLCPPSISLPDHRQGPAAVQRHPDQELPFVRGQGEDCEFET